MNLGPPQNQDEFARRFQENQRVEGYGFQVNMHLPCPFCAAGDWLVHHIIDTQTALSNGAVCRECGRGAKAVFVEFEDSLAMEVVQTSGAAQPPWLQPQLRDLRHALN